MSKILLAEDDNDMRRFLAKALEKAGYEVTSYDNGASAYERLREEPFSLLLTDIVMPEMDGIELARRATELDPDLKVMFITGFAAVALNPDSKLPRTPRSCPSRSIFASWLKRSASCCRTPHDFLSGAEKWPRNHLTGRRPYGLCRSIEWACSSAGEHYVDIVGVTGSIPVTPTIRSLLYRSFLVIESCDRQVHRT